MTGSHEHVALVVNDYMRVSVVTGSHVDVALEVHSTAKNKIVP